MTFTRTLGTRFCAVLALLVTLAALVAMPAPRLPLAEIRHAAAAIRGTALPETRGILPTVLPERATLRAPDEASPDPVVLQAIVPAPVLNKPAHAAWRRAVFARVPEPAGGEGRHAHPARAPPHA
ncbi:MAG: hypothetical protein GYB50_26250 [Rhodobacteraceae bacterium]|nr:hypothetical protein [Paracoccaceae bacterium]